MIAAKLADPSTAEDRERALHLVAQDFDRSVRSGFTGRRGAIERCASDQDSLSRRERAP